MRGSFISLSSIANAAQMREESEGRFSGRAGSQSGSAFSTILDAAGGTSAGAAPASDASPNPMSLTAQSSPWAAAMASQNLTAIAYAQGLLAAQAPTQEGAAAPAAAGQANGAARQNETGPALKSDPEPPSPTAQSTPWAAARAAQNPTAIAQAQRALAAQAPAQEQAVAPSAADQADGASAQNEAGPKSKAGSKQSSPTAQSSQWAPAMASQNPMAFAYAQGLLAAQAPTQEGAAAPSAADQANGVSSQNETATQSLGAQAVPPAGETGARGAAVSSTADQGRIGSAQRAARRSAAGARAQVASNPATDVSAQALDFGTQRPTAQPPVASPSTAQGDATLARSAAMQGAIWNGSPVLEAGANTSVATASPSPQRSARVFRSNSLSAGVSNPAAQQSASRSSQLNFGAAPVGSGMQAQNANLSQPAAVVTSMDAAPAAAADPQPPARAGEKAAESSSSAPRSWAFSAAAGQLGSPASAQTQAPGNEVKTAPDGDQTVSSSPSAASAPSPIGDPQNAALSVKMDAASFETQFPQLIAQTWSNDSRAAGASASGVGNAGAPLAAGVASQPKPGGVQTLSIELSPEAYGAMTVAMTFSRKGVALQIDVASDHAAALLRSSETGLRKAIETAGGSMEALSVQISPALAAGDSSLAAATTGDASAQPGSSNPFSGDVSGQDGFSDGGQGAGNNSAAEQRRQSQRADASRGARAAFDAGLYV